jgi:hypothetical protein
MGSEFYNNYEPDYCIHCECDLTHRDDGDDTCCWCLERIQKEKNNGTK